MTKLGNIAEEIEAIVEQYRQEHGLSGTMLISKGDEIVFEKAFGQANMQLAVPNTLDTKFHIASVTKMFIATAALRLQEQGLLNFSQQPGHYVPAMHRLHPAITLHHLISHTSGLHDIYAVPNLRLEMSRLKVEGGDFLTYLVNQEQLFEPGDKWKYNSTGFILMGYIMEAVTGLTFGELMANLFFTPLDMRQTGLDQPRTINSGRAYGHTIEKGIYVNADNDKLCEVDAPGELYSSARDLNTWCRALMDGRLLAQSSMKAMFKGYVAVDFDPSMMYGYGWFLGDRFRLIGGGTPGFRSEVWHYPENKVNVIMLWNDEKVDSHKLFRRIRPLIV